MNYVFAHVSRELSLFDAQKNSQGERAFVQVKKSRQRKNTYRLINTQISSFFYILLNVS